MEYDLRHRINPRYMYIKIVYDLRANKDIGWYMIKKRESLFYLDR